jgi:hypothetical protein
MDFTSHWKKEHLMSPNFQISVFASEFGLTIASGNGIISFTGPDDNAVAKLLVGKTFNLLFEEIMVDIKPKFIKNVPLVVPVKPVVVDVKPPVVVNVTPAPASISNNVNDLVWNQTF